MKRWEELPDWLRVPEVRPYYDALAKKRASLFCKSLFDRLAGLTLLLLLAAPMLAIALAVKLDSEGPVFYRQERVTRYGRRFRIHKFRSMVSNAEQIGSALTVGNDSRITRVGARLRGTRLDELPQLLDVVAGDMSFVGTRPEVPRYVAQYSREMLATLLLPAGITSEASIRFKDEDKLLEGAADVDKVYVEQVLPQKMAWNLKSIEDFSFHGELRTMVRTVLAVCGRDYSGRAGHTPGKS